jgi:adenylate kinase
VVFSASDEALVKRLSGRRSCPECGAVYNVHFTPPAKDQICDRCGGTLVHRADDEAETVRRRLVVYREQTEPLIAWYKQSEAKVVEVDADRPVDEVQTSFRKAVGRGGR